METTRTDAGPRTRALLTCGMLAGPVYVVTALAQAATRQGFDLLHHDVSLLALGPMGWIQIVNFLVTGALVVACAVGVRRVTAPARRTTWGVALVAAYGIGVIGGGVFAADAVPGFPPGTTVTAGTFTWHGILHLLCAALGFFALAAANFVLARPGSPGWTRYSRLSGVVFLVCFLGGVGGGGNAAGVLALWAAVVIGFTWIFVLALRLRRGEGSTS